MDRFIADAVKETILFNAREREEKVAFQRSCLEQFFDYGYYVQMWRHCQRLIYKVGRGQSNHTLLNSLE